MQYLHIYTDNNQEASKVETNYYIKYGTYSSYSINTLVEYILLKFMFLLVLIVLTQRKLISVVDLV